MGRSERFNIYYCYFQNIVLTFILEKYLNCETDCEKKVTCIIRKWNETFLPEQKYLSNFFGFIEDFCIDLTDILIFFFVPDPAVILLCWPKLISFSFFFFSFWSLNQKSNSSTSDKLTI